MLCVDDSVAVVNSTTERRVEQILLTPALVARFGMGRVVSSSAVRGATSVQQAKDNTHRPLVDGNLLVTGQNQNAAPMVARELMQLLAE